MTTPIAASPWLALPGLRRARPVVDDSWARSRRYRLDPERASAPIALTGDALAHRRASHPLSLAMPVIRRLLVDDAVDSNVLVAVGDAEGRLLWVDGDRDLKRRAESMFFVEGAAWAEGDVGTSAPGTALALDHGIQIHGAEHFAAAVRAWSCTAVPVHDPETGSVIGVIDLTGGAEVIAPHALRLVEATAAAVERELLIHRLRTARPSSRRPVPIHSRSTLSVLGRDTGLLTIGGRQLELGSRHAEIMTMLSRHPEGLSADRLAYEVYGRDDAVLTLRAEMVRLRHRLDQHARDLVPESRPYRLRHTPELDVLRVFELLDRGAHRAAIAAGASSLLMHSESPGIRDLREELVGRLRESVLESASLDVLLDWARSPAGLDDVEIWRSALQLLPARSPRRAGIVAHLEALERSLRR